MNEKLSAYNIVGSTVTFGTTPGLAGTSIVGLENPVEPFGPVLTGYRSIGGAILSLDVLHPLSSALPVVMQVDIPQEATGEVGFLNEGDARHSNRWFGKLTFFRVVGNGH